MFNFYLMWAVISVDIFLKEYARLVGVVAKSAMSKPPKEPKKPSKEEPKTDRCKLHDWVNCSKHEEGDPDSHLVCTQCGKIPGEK